MSVIVFHTTFDALIIVKIFLILQKWKFIYHYLMKIYTAILLR